MGDRHWQGTQRGRDSGPADNRPDAGRTPLPERRSRWRNALQPFTTTCEHTATTKIHIPSGPTIIDNGTGNFSSIGRHKCRQYGWKFTYSLLGWVELHHPILQPKILF